MVQVPKLGVRQVWGQDGQCLSVLRHGMLLQLGSHFAKRTGLNANNLYESQIIGMPNPAGSMQIFAKRTQFHNSG